MHYLEQQNIIERIWRKDHTVWKPDPTEITNRLGWLTIVASMREHAPFLETFASEVRDSGFCHVVLLGMGGSSLCAEVVKRTLGNAPGYPELIVLDSTIPATIRTVTDAIDPKKTLFLVSSKSGTTTETIALYQYFHNVVASALGEDKTGLNFVAITDPETPLAKLAIERGFRHTFLNPIDIGGRYSVLSFFGLVPASLMGIDLATFLNRVESMQKRCSPSRSLQDNDGALLGCIIGALVLQGRDKLTFITSPGIDSFGLWAEQLIAESTGKEGKGIIPVVAEPLVDKANYGDDRLFIYLRMKDDENSRTDTAVESIRVSGQPVLTIEMQDRYDLGAEFFRWEFATSIAGAIVGINPFDQPDVQATKEATEQVLKDYAASGKLPQAEATYSAADLIAKAKRGNYLATLLYAQQTPELDRAITDLRRRAVEKHRIATMMCYGPRYLHSTGQLHKGGPNIGLFLLITMNQAKDIPIPDRPYSFGVLAHAQALGDLRALRSAGRYVARVHLDRTDGAAINGLLSETV
jgi:glucose-6-phosphate isomerase/transaldolase/glucose-6-phosphate isomerase